MDTNEQNIIGLLGVAYKRKRIILVFFVILFSVVLMGTLSSTPIYMASTKLIIERSDQSVLSPQANYYEPYDPDFYETQYQLIRSTAVAAKVVEMLSLDKADGTGDGARSRNGGTFGWFRGLFQSAGSQPAGGGEMGGGQTPLRAESLAKSISAGIEVKPEKNSRIVTVSYMSSDPELAVSVANSVAEAYIEQILDMKMAFSRYTLQWMTKKSDEERAKLSRSERVFQEYVKAKDIVTLENRIAVLPQKLSAIGTQLIKDRSRMNELEALYHKVKGITDLNEAETILLISNEPVLQALRGEILKAEQGIGELSKVYGKRHPKLIRAKEELRALNEKRERETGRVIESIRNEYDLAKTKVEKSEKLLTETKAEALDLNEKFLQYEMLRKEVDASRQLYDALLNKMKEQSLTEHVRNVNIWILEKAQKPERPSKPDIPRNVLLAILIGLFGGIGLAFVVEHLDSTIKSVGEAEAKLGVPILGMVPFLKPSENKIEGILRDDPNSTYAESYRNIRTSILLSSADAPPKHLLVTSMEPKEGKTATSINLAAAISQSEKTVLLIDSDLRKPNIHRVLDIDNELGLSTYLAGASGLSVVTIEEGSMRGIDVLTSGPVPPNPSELLSSGKLAKLVREVGDKYDVIIFDSSPLLAIADSLILSKVVDGTILVIRAEKTTYGIVRKGMKSLSDFKSNVLGVVVNAVDVKKHDYYYYSYNYYPSGKEEGR
jgi:capsular exopolysaccharide synthesis family protein